VFGEVADLYERRRPGYPAELYEYLLALVGPDGRVLEAGAGTGRATVELARRGLDVVALEHDPAMAAIARRATDGLAARIEERPFEDWDGEPGSFDAVVSAQAWHWIDPERGPAVARRALVPGGVLAAWWNRVGEWEDSLRAAIDDAYERHAPELLRSAANRSVDDLGLEGQSLPGFAPVQKHTYSWTRRYDSVSYTELLQTHSDHVMLPAEQLSGLLEAVADAIDRAGGEFVYPYRTILLTAQKASE
jgi:SAM-dependent methyltransferase